MMMAKKQIRSAGYSRVSGEKQVDEGSSLEEHRAKIEKKAKEEGWKLIELYQDAGVSLERNNRLGYDDLRSCAVRSLTLTL